MEVTAHPHPSLTDRPCRRQLRGGGTGRQQCPLPRPPVSRQWVQRGSAAPPGSHSTAGTLFPRSKSPLRALPTALQEEWLGRQEGVREGPWRPPTQPSCQSRADTFISLCCRPAIPQQHSIPLLPENKGGLRFQATGREDGAGPGRRAASAEEQRGSGLGLEWRWGWGGLLGWG